MVVPLEPHTRRPRPRNVKALGALALVVATAACGSDTSTETASLPVERCLGAEIDENRDTVFEGLSEGDARSRAAADGLTVRVVGRGDECLPRHSDYRVRRINLYLDDAGSVVWAGHF